MPAHTAERLAVVVVADIAAVERLVVASVHELPGREGSPGDEPKSTRCRVPARFDLPALAVA